MTIREKLAELLTKKTGALFEPHKLLQNNPMHIHYEDVCLWDAWGVLPATEQIPVARRIHVYSWDTMTSCVKEGISLLSHRDDHNDFEVVAG
jgi:hypothetical protein